ncbi:MAG TPA: oxaloacetate decarboxylase, partial [Propionibacteriaceae bacterium]|nr:oxaloacetate decarboxylase [Propionibacteriaceae bacterium]
FATVRPKYREFESATLVDTGIFSSQIPGGMLSNMESQLKAQGAGDRIREVMAEVPIVKKDAGYPPLVTPSSQIVGTQAVFNVLMGRYKVMTGEFADLMLGYYGECIGERNPEVVAIAQAQAKKEPITHRPADLLEPEWQKLEADAAKLEGFNGTEEDVLTNAMFPGVAPKFFAHRNEGPKSVGKTPEQLAHERAIADGSAKAVRSPIRYNVTFAGRTHSVQVEPA